MTRTASQVAEEICDVVESNIDREGAWDTKEEAIKKVAAALEQYAKEAKAEGRAEGLEEAAKACREYDTNDSLICADRIEALQRPREGGK